jgi:BirA family biotin operon repressor/biotin-[acetyl-CoA-carboxylase] ligase
MIVFGDGRFDPAGFRRLKEFLLFDEVDSTNSLAQRILDRASDDDVELRPAAIAALTQRAGRGRRARRWDSPRGGLYATVMLPLAAPAPVALLPLAAALVVARALESEWGIPARFKWPNDVLCGDRKIAGILTRAKSRGAEVHAAVGIGINVRASMEEEIGPRATTVEREAGRRATVASMLSALCRQIDDFLEIPAWETIVERWIERTVHAQGDRLTIVLEDRPRSAVVGTFAGLTQDGFLRLSVDGIPTVVGSGEVESW